MNYKKRDDSIYGAARYLANTLGIQIEKNTYSTIDEVLSPSQIRDKWRQASFSCKCLMNHDQLVHGERAFCSQCSFLIFHNNVPDIDNAQDA
jgi:hypothetical protein